MSRVGNSSSNNASVGVDSSQLDPEAASQLYHTSLASIAAIAALVWDMVLTFEEERIYVWKSSLRSVKCPFLAVRYLSLLLQINVGIFLYTNIVSPSSNHTCSIYKWIGGAGTTILVGITDILLIFRVFAFFERNKRLLYFLITLYFCVHISAITVYFFSLSSYEDIAVDPGQTPRWVFGNCIVVDYPHRLVFAWPLLLIFQSTLFFCVFFRAIYTRYGDWKLGLCLSPLYTVFIRDGVWAYLLIALNLTLGLIYTSQNSPFALTWLLWLITISSICSCRLILNLRGVDDTPTSLERFSFSLKSMKLVVGNGRPERTITV